MRRHRMRKGPPRSASGTSAGAAGAKRYYQGAQKPKDVRDLAAYVACAKQAGADGPSLAGMQR